MPTEVELVEQRITRRLRRLRLERGLTLDAVAAPAGLTAGYLSRVEQGHRVPSIGTLVLLANSLDVTLADLTAGDEEHPSPVIRRADAPRIAGEGVEVRQVSPPARSAVLDATVLRLESGAIPPRPAEHDGEEWVHVVSGTLELTLAGEHHLLHTGDSAQFDGRTAHVLAGSPDAEVVVVIARGRPSRR